MLGMGIVLRVSESGTPPSPTMEHLLLGRSGAHGLFANFPSEAQGEAIDTLNNELPPSFS
jgi:hypothetical protein